MEKHFLFKCLCFFPFVIYSQAFQAHNFRFKKTTVSFKSSLLLRGESNKDSDFPNSVQASTRRDVIRTVGSVSLASWFFQKKSLAAQEPVVVIGAGGKTGKECVRSLLRRGLPCIAASRGELQLDVDKENENLLKYSLINVADGDSLAQVIQPGVGGVIFAASASKKGGNPKEVDFQGLVNVAKACVAAQVPRLVVVSSGGVSKPDSAVYKFLNLFGEIMKYKIMGEDAVREIYAGSSNSQLGYTIVRPGGLTEEALLGVKAIELNQGDTKSGRIARADVAEVCVEALFCKSAKNTTFECYYADTAKPLDGVGVSNLLKKKTKEEEAVVLGLERRGDSWAQLFDGLRVDA